MSDLLYHRDWARYWRMDQHVAKSREVFMATRSEWNRQRKGETPEARYHGDEILYWKNMPPLSHDCPYCTSPWCAGDCQND